MPTWSIRTKPSTSWNDRTAIDTTWQKPRNAAYLLNEDGSYLLNEDGSRLLLQESEFASTQWTTRIIPS